MEKNYYIKLRDKYLPDNLRLVIIAESPPASGRYFYDPDGRTSEPLFRAIMPVIVNIAPRSKRDGLTAFRGAGMFLVDAVYQPVNKGYTKTQRNQIILRNYPGLKRDLVRIVPEEDVPILLIKANVCKMLESELSRDNFIVLNRGQIIPFPASGHQRRFREIVANILP